MRQYLLVTLFLVSHSLFAQLQTDKITPYQNIVFGVTKGSGNSIGSAFIVGKNSDYYYLATAKHVVRGDQELLLTSLTGSQHPATVVASHAVHDIALLRTPIFALDLDSIPIVTNLSMNDEVAFVSVKDSGKILPSKSPGIVRDVNGESVSVIMKEVESGHSGSPLISSTGIAGMITKNGKFIQCINIVLVKEIIEEWGDDLFESRFIEKHIAREKMASPKEISTQSDAFLPLKTIRGDGRCSNIINLVDHNLYTSWSCTGKSGDSALIYLELTSLSSVSKIKIHIADDSSTKFPHGYVSVYYKGGKSRFSLDKILKYKEKQGNGHWYTYIFKKPMVGNEIIFNFSYIGDTSYSINFQEIQLHGINL